MRLAPIMIGAAALTMSAAAMGAQPRLSPQDQIVALEQARLRAFAQADKPAFSRLVSDDLTIVHSDGSVGNKADELANMRVATPDRPLPSLELTAPNVRMHGNAAVMTGQLVERKDGRVLLRLTFTNTYVKAKDGWRLVAGQLTKAVP